MIELLVILILSTRFSRMKETNLQRVMSKKSLSLFKAVPIIIDQIQNIFCLNLLILDKLTL